MCLLHNDCLTPCFFDNARVFPGSSLFVETIYLEDNDNTLPFRLVLLKQIIHLVIHSVVESTLRLFLCPGQVGYFQHKSEREH